MGGGEYEGPARAHVLTTLDNTLTIALRKIRR